MNGLASWIRTNKAKAAALGGGSLLALLVVIGALASPQENTAEDVAAEGSPAPTIETAEPTPSAPLVTPSARNPAGGPRPAPTGV